MSSLFSVLEHPLKHGRRSPGWVKNVVLVMWWESQCGVGTIWTDDKGPLDYASY